ncbi:MAG: hypothetical protein M0P00_03695 [Bacteroidaceae bacterium]|nr:hypothetical protein [Bacteroidaceae bacterium]
MKTIVSKIIDAVLTVVPLLGKKKENMVEFTDLVKGQYSFLIEQLEKVLKDYCELSDKLKQVHEEMCSLREQLVEAVSGNVKE